MFDRLKVAKSGLGRTSAAALVLNLRWGALGSGPWRSRWVSICYNLAHSFARAIGGPIVASTGAVAAFGAGVEAVQC